MTITRKSGVVPWRGSYRDFTFSSLIAAGGEGGLLPAKPLEGGLLKKPPCPPPPPPSHVLLAVTSRIHLPSPSSFHSLSSGQDLSVQEEEEGRAGMTGVYRPQRLVGFLFRLG